MRAIGWAYGLAGHSFVIGACVGVAMAASQFDDGMMFLLRCLWMVAPLAINAFYAWVAIDALREVIGDQPYVRQNREKV